MKSLINSIFIFCLLLFGSFNNPYIQSINENNGRLEKHSIDNKKNKPINDYQQLYSKIEYRRDSTLNLLKDSLTLIKYHIDNLGSNERKIIFYYQQERIVAIVQRIYNNMNEILAYKVFYFEGNNNCDWYTTRNNKDLGSHTYSYLNGNIVESDFKISPIILENPQKQNIIHSSKASLDSIMQHFPEFKYSMNWK